jgi:hypothetical protein
MTLSTNHTHVRPRQSLYSLIHSDVKIFVDSFSKWYVIGAIIYVLLFVIGTHHLRYSYLYPFVMMELWFFTILNLITNTPISTLFKFKLNNLDKKIYVRFSIRTISFILILSSLVFQFNNQSVIGWIIKIICLILEMITLKCLYLYLRFWETRSKY